MEEQANEETPQAEDSMLEDEEQEEEEEEEDEEEKEELEEEEDEEEELTDAEIVELEEGTDDEEQVDVAVNVELGDDTLQTTADAAQGTDELFTADVEATEEEITEIGPEEPQFSEPDDIVDADDEMDQPATMSADRVDVLEQRSIPTVSADLGDEDTVALEDGPSQPDTLSPDTHVGRYTTADYEEEDEELDERAEYADADETDEMRAKKERPTVTTTTDDVPGV